MWMAVSAYYDEVCNKDYGGLVIMQEDFDERGALLDASPGWQANPSVFECNLCRSLTEEDAISPSPQRVLSAKN